MHYFFTYVGIGLLLLMVILMYRVIVGPTAVDRMIAVNMIGTKTTILLVIIGAWFHQIDMYVDLALSYAMLNFIASVAAAKLIRRRSEDFRWPVPDGRMKRRPE